MGSGSLLLCWSNGPLQNNKFQIPILSDQNRFGTWNFGHCDLPFDFAQGGESFDSAQDREPVERLVEPFDIWDL
jgi:hypothetical protein